MTTTTPTSRSHGLLRTVHRRLPKALRVRLRMLLRRTGLVPTDVPDDEHPERIAVLQAVGEGRVLEVGCGPRKSSRQFVGVDLTPGGQLGLIGNAAGRASQADVAADGRFLPFAGARFDAVVARHNLEHYVNPIGVLREWRRVLKPAGRIVLVVPDEDSYPGRTLDLDPTHYHAFNESFLRALFEVLGWPVVTLEECVPNWSLLVVVEPPTA